MYKMTHTILAGLFFIASPVLADEATDLEPCINGDVSASGLFVSQEAEDSFMQQQAITVAQWDLEPCINGDVSAFGLFISQEAEDSYKQHRISDL